MDLLCDMLIRRLPTTLAALLPWSTNCSTLEFSFINTNCSLSLTCGQEWLNPEVPPPPVDADSTELLNKLQAQLQV